MRRKLGEISRDYGARASERKLRRGQADVIRVRENIAAHRQNSLGRDHPNTLESYDWLARAYFAVGRYSDAILLLEFNLAALQRIGESGDKISINRGQLGRRLSPSWTSG